MNCPMCGELWNNLKCDTCGWFEGKQQRYSPPAERPDAPAVTPELERIVKAVTERFNCFGRGAQTTGLNPIEAAMKDKPPAFALGVDVEQVVRFVLEASRD